MTTLFADDTTFVISSDNYQSLETQLKTSLKHLIEWCDYNRLYVNWSKTFIMVITNKRVVIPQFIEYNNIKIEIVKQFKLLGVIIDNKLNFNDYVSQQCRVINKKLFLIKRLFYSKEAIRRLCKAYYICLHKLFNFNFYCATHEIINKKLKCFNLFSFHHRLVYRISLFINRIMSSLNSQLLLRSWLTPSTVHNEHHDTRSNNKTVFVLERTHTKFGDLSFKNSFGRFLNNIDYAKFSMPFAEFKKDLLCGNLCVYMNVLLKLIPKFNINIDFYFFYF